MRLCVCTHAYLGADVMHAGGDVLGRGVASEHMTLENVGQFVPRHISKVPATTDKSAEHTPTQIHKAECR